MVGFNNWYINKLHIAARKDQYIAYAFRKVTNLVAPHTSILRPQIAYRVWFKKGINPTFIPLMLLILAYSGFKVGGGSTGKA
jgi:hypothetical protein